MSEANTWLLPDGVADILPTDALLREKMRRQSIDTMLAHGYALVEPPLVEYTESLLNCADESLKRQTFRIIDQLTGRLMGVRADLTHQVARIDTHVLPTEKVARYCYAAPVLHTRPKTTFASRTPMQVGAELYGHAGISADIEIINLMMTLLANVGVYCADKPTGLHINLGNVAIFASLAQLAQLDTDTQTQLLSLYQRKALPELKVFCESISINNAVNSNTNHTPNGIQGSDFYVLAQYSQDVDALLAKLSPAASGSEAVKRAIYDLKRLQNHLQENWAMCHASVDAAELASYHYHTGVVFSLYGEYDAAEAVNDNNTSNSVLLLGQGGRYDGIGKNFGRERAATGFSCGLDKLLAFANNMAGFASSNTDSASTENASTEQSKRIAAPALNDPALAALVKQARAEGHVIINKLSDNDGEHATHEFMIVEKQWVLVGLEY